MNAYKFDESIHAHTLNGKPLYGASTIVGVLSKPLTWWASARAVETLGWTDPKKTSKDERLSKAEIIHKNIQDMKSAEYLSLLDVAYKAHSVNLKKTAKAGIDLHSILETYINNFITRTVIRVQDDDELQKIDPFIEWTKKNVKRFLWSEAHCYSERLWVGGISDFGCELNDGSLCVGDFKSARAAYTSHFLQDALYALCIEENGLYDKNGNKIWNMPDPEIQENNYIWPKEFDKLIVVPFGADPVVPIIKDSLEFKRIAPSLVEVFKFVSREDK